MVSSGVWAAFKKAKIQKACQEVRALESAITLYYQTYSRLPLGDQNDHMHENNGVSVRDNQARLKNIVAILRGDDAPNGMPAGQNSRKIAFLNIDPALDGGPNSQILEDPWGRPYMFYFDMNYDGTIVLGEGLAWWNTSSVDVKVIIHSKGPNGLDWANGEDSKSWMQEHSDDIWSRIPGIGYRNG